MKEITMFHFASCPYCRKALKFIDELKAENPELKDVKINMIDERKEPEIADKYDYYYVPTFYIGEEKLHEGDISKAEMKEVLEKALQ